VFANCLFQKVGAVIKNEQDEEVVVARGWWSRSAADKHKWMYLVLLWSIHLLGDEGTCLGS